MLRPLILTTDLQPGGLPLRMVRLAIKLASLGVRPIVGCLAGRTALHETLENEGLETFACGARGPRDLGALVRLRRIIRRTNPDVIHASLFHANVAARLLGTLDRRRPIITSTVTIEIERSWHRWGEMLTAPLSTMHVANSQAVAKHLVCDLGMDPGRVKVIPNGLGIGEIDRTPPINRGAYGIPGYAPLVLWAGRLDPVKQVERFVDIAAELHESLGAYGVIAGDGPRRDAVRAHIDARRMTNVVRMVGWRDDVIAWLKASDLLVLCSRTEGSPNVILEAMACGCPVIASDIDSCREMLGGGSRGALAPPGETSAFVRAAREILTNPEQTGRRRAALDHVREFHDLNQVARRWQMGYETALAR